MQYLSYINVLTNGMTSRLYATCRGRYGANSVTFEYTYCISFYKLNMLNEVQKSEKN